MSETNINTHANIGFYYIGWKYYNKIRKKAMEQEFSWSGLLISLSIAFFIVISTAFLLNFIHQTLEKKIYHSQHPIYEVNNIRYFDYYC